MSDKTNEAEKLGLVQDDPWLEPYESDILARLDRFQEKKSQIEADFGSLRGFALAYQHMGLKYDADKKGWWYKEWAPAATSLSLIGDFNQWDRSACPLTKNEAGLWTCFISEKKYQISHEQLLKVHVVGQNGATDRIPAWIRRAWQDPESHDFSGQYWAPAKPFKWTDGRFKPKKEDLFIYECHVGMSQERAGLGTYIEFADHILPRIKQLGYNAIQLMAVQEHPYYGSFGYHVSNFFAPSARFGKPEDLKYLINTAHKLGIAVIMDVVHSHAVKNIAEGLNNFDGSGGQYFHEGSRGEHPGWDSKLFNYGKIEVLQFLLSNLAYWMEEFHFDGFRFDGVTSMLYYHHGEGVSFDHYGKYFKDDVEWDAICYLQLANALVHEINPHAISIAEDMSGMPGTCRPIQEGGLGFDYRLAMGIPDYWIKLLKHSRDEDWNMHELWHTLTNRRWKENNIAYAESHDQALVGDKTLAFWLMDKEMYWHMHKDDGHPIIARGMALHKMIRLFTASLGGEAYLNFMGNEFGHPEWVDFPREGNNWSYQHARRQWSLADHADLKYQYLQAFDQAMVQWLKKGKILRSDGARQINLDTENQVLIFERNRYIFLFNFHVERSIPDYRFWVPRSGDYEVILNTDHPDFGGYGRIDDQMIYSTSGTRKNPQLSIYLTNRTALVLRKKRKTSS